MNSFSFNRFGKMLCWVLSVNFKRMMGFTIGGGLGWFLAELIIIKLNGLDDPHTMVWNISQFGCVAFMLMLVIFISTVVSSVNSKPKREAFSLFTVILMSGRSSSRDIFTSRAPGSCRISWRQLLKRQEHAWYILLKFCVPTTR